MDFVPPIDSKSALIQVVTWRLTGDNPLPEPTLTKISDVHGITGCFFNVWLFYSLNQLS